MPKTETMTMEVRRIEDQGDRVLFYGKDDSFYVISAYEESREVSLRDTIAYEPYGVNFGWFIKKVSQ